MVEVEKEEVETGLTEKYLSPVPTQSLTPGEVLAKVPRFQAVPGSGAGAQERKV